MISIEGERTMNKIMNKLPGVALTAMIAIPALLIGKAFPIVGGPVLGILFGMLLAFWKRPQLVQSGISYTSKKLLQYSIILLGFDMNLYHVIAAGKQTILLMVFTLLATCLTAWLVGKQLRLEWKTTTLVGVGTAICGGSAIAATAPVIGANEEQIAHSISTIFLFNVIAAFLFPFLGHLLGMSDYSFGLWAGTAINDTSSVVAAGYTYSDIAGDLAVIVKLARTLMIVPITIVLAIIMSKKSRHDQKEEKESRNGYSLVRIFPWFIVGFVLASIINTFVALPAGFGSALAQCGKFVITMAMVAIGLNTNVVKLVKSGGKSITLGFICWLILAVTSIVVQHFILHV